MIIYPAWIGSSLVLKKRFIKKGEAMSFEFKLPDIGEGVAEGEVVKWLIKPGDTVKEDQPIVEIMTDKATVEIASPRDGKIEKVLAGEGQIVKVGNVLVTIDEGLRNGKSKGKEKAESAEQTEKPEALFTASTPPPRKQEPSTNGGSPSSGRVLASPATRRAAREKGIDLSHVQGSGPMGRVTRDDLDKSGGRSAASPAPAYKPRATEAKGGEERIPLRGIRKRISEHMTKSRHTAMHFTQVDEVDVTDLVEFREKVKNDFAAQGVKVSYLAFVVQALCATLKKFPSMNGALDDEKQEIVIKHFYNIGIAAQTDAGLMVPVIKNADQKSILELSAEIGSLAEKARTGKLSLDEMTGGTFTITSTGNSGGLFATPIINHPELGILGFNRIKDTPVVRNGQITVRKIAHFSLSLDHRVIDGAVGADFLRTLINYIENPRFFLLDA
jgi:pyruvate dehydrogenase E2 component (dihydrolipoamide acetyltransferase)